MNLPISWLQDFVNVKATPENIAERLTLSGSEVEKITRNDEGLSDVVVGLIKDVKPHPDADKLQLASVDVGKSKLLEIVCGAPNIAAGQKVPVVLLGGSVPGLKIEPRTIRGIASQGMLASERELGIGDDHSGIFILPSDVSVGTDVISLLELSDPVFDIDVTPNRPDCFSVKGLAREVAALYGKQVQEKKHHLKESSERASAHLSVSIEDKKLCTRYCARRLVGIAVKPSPLWLQNRLRQVGIRPINNVVDATNFVMMEYGHPLHAFDASLLGERIVVRRAKKGEQLAALDEETYALDGSMLVIADAKRPVALAGVMGGAETAVRNETTDVVLEVAVFDSVSIRKTSRALGVRSESSTRFEKGVDASAVELVVDRAAALITELAGGAVQKGIVSAGSAQSKIAPISLALSDVERLLGVSVSGAEVKAILQSLGCGVSGSGKAYTVTPPAWRVHDLRAEADIVEEIGRMLDYNTFVKTLPTAPLRSPLPDEAHRTRRAVRRFCLSSGYSELLSYGFYGEDGVVLSDYDKDDHIVLTNPVNDEYPYLRTSLVPWMLKRLSQNSAQLVRDRVQLFEIGNVFHRADGESPRLVLGITDTTATPERLYRELRGVVEKLCGVRFDAERFHGWILLKYQNKPLGVIRTGARNIFPGVKFRGPVGVAHVDLALLSEACVDERSTYEPIPFYPIIERDLGVVASNMVEYTSLEKAISDFDELIREVSLFDVYHGLADGVSLAFRLKLYSRDRTLESTEVDHVIEKLKAQLHKKFGVTFRE